MHILIDIELKNILGQFKQIDICRFVHDMQFFKKKSFQL
jgi:hypothetical protein